MVSCAAKTPCIQAVAHSVVVVGQHAPAPLRSSVPWRRATVALLGPQHDVAVVRARQRRRRRAGAPSRRSSCMRVGIAAGGRARRRRDRSATSGGASCSRLRTGGASADLGRAERPRRPAAPGRAGRGRHRPTPPVVRLEQAEEGPASPWRRAPASRRRDCDGRRRRPRAAAARPAGRAEGQLEPPVAEAGAESCSASVAKPAAPSRQPCATQGMPAALRQVLPAHHHRARARGCRAT